MLKQLIQRLLDSRTTPAQAVQADRINISTETTFSTDEFVPPRDGFVRVWGKVQQGLEGTAIALNVSNGTTVQGISRLAFTGPSSANDIVQTWPVRKGEAISLSFFNIDVQLRTFYDAIGGGYLRSFVSAVCKRGELCLSRLSLCLPRSSCRTNPNGLAVKQTSQSQHPGLFSKLPTTPHKSIRRLRTAGLRLGAPNLASTLVSQVRFNLSSLIRKAISEFLPLFEKATQSAFTAKQKTSNRSRQGSFQTKAPHNLLSMGGALC